MNLGQLRHKVTIQEQQGTVSDGGGNKIPNWVDVQAVWAHVSPLNGNESVVANTNGQRITHIVKMRYRPIKKDLTRLMFNGRVLKIQWIINPNEQNRELRLQCLEG